MALLNLFFELQTKRLVFSETNGRTVILPDLYREDSFSIDFRALQRIRTIGSPLFNRVNLSGYSLTISVGVVADTPLAQASSWVASDSGTLLTGTLNMSTAGINALADQTSALFEVKLSSGAEAYRGQFNVVIRKSLATSGSIVTVVSDIALGVAEADRTYIRKQGRPGEAQVLTSDDGTKQGIIYWHNDGSFRAEAIT
jgi:hypothetical protein